MPSAAIARVPQGGNDGSTVGISLMADSMVGSFSAINEGQPLPLSPNLEANLKPAAAREGLNGSGRAAGVAPTPAASMEGDGHSSCSAGTARAAQDAARAWHDRVGDEIESVCNLEPMQVRLVLLQNLR